MSTCSNTQDAEAAEDRSRAWQILEAARKLVSDRAQRKWLQPPITTASRLLVARLVVASQMSERYHAGK